MAVGTQSPGSWLDLADEHCRVLVLAFEETPLIHILGALTPAGAAHSWNRKGEFVETAIRISIELLDQGLVTVWDEPVDGVGEGAVLFPDEARAVLLERRSWWAFDPDDSDAGAVPERQRMETDDSRLGRYELIPQATAGLLGDPGSDARVHPIVHGRIRLSPWVTAP